MPYYCTSQDLFGLGYGPNISKYHNYLHHSPASLSLELDSAYLLDSLCIFSDFAISALTQEGCCDFCLPLKIRQNSHLNHSLYLRNGPCLPELLGNSFACSSAFGLTCLSLDCQHLKIDLASSDSGLTYERYSRGSA